MIFRVQRFKIYNFTQILMNNCQRKTNYERNMVQKCRILQKRLSEKTFFVKNKSHTFLWKLRWNLKKFYRCQNICFSQEKLGLCKHCHRILSHIPKNRFQTMQDCLLWRYPDILSHVLKTDQLSFISSFFSSIPNKKCVNVYQWYKKMKYLLIIFVGISS